MALAFDATLRENLLDLAGLPCPCRFGGRGSWQPPGTTPDERQAALEEAAQSLLESAGEDDLPALDNEEIPAGYTYFGQFVDHDILALVQRSPGGPVVNLRRPALNLDSLYGDGPDFSPHLYDKEHSGRFLFIERFEPRELDLWRRDDGIALAGDPRNDENVLVAQMHAAFLRLHNARVDLLPPGPAAFSEARRWLTWRYQWLVLNDFLPRLVGPDRVRERLAAARVGAAEIWPLSLEFSAAYRFGHSMVRSRYALNASLLAGQGKISIFEPGETVPGEPRLDLRGGEWLPPGWGIDWSYFFPVGPTAPQPSRKIDGKINRKLGDLPGPGGTTPSLPLRNLARGVDFGLASGQEVARALGLKPISNGALGLGEPFGAEAPLWAYVLKEAEAGGGTGLGPVGAALVTETLVGLVVGDPDSFWSHDPDWQPEVKTVGELLSWQPPAEEEAS